MPRTFHSEAYAAFIERLADARQTAGITQVDLAKRLGRHQSFVSNYESRIRRLDIIETLVVARAIGLDPASLIKDLDASISSEMTI